ncbi:hypothetical protein [Segeticoccus rhizosphaerae]|uniref:hypothetical protein n=1 Tax=Segeticoccus rhizosphaerae TaxID=1104777 RepID=UPI0010C13C4B|nr:hypothetical protein [Ornithinicoccus soli]
MAVVTLTSASGSPGVTSSALGLALTWPRPVVLVEADPTGGSGVLAGYFHGDVAHTGGLIDLPLAHRQGALAQALPASMLEIPGSSARLLPGVRGHGQARSLAGVWEPLCVALRGLERGGQDVIVDAGRLGLVGAPEPLVRGGDLTLLTMRSSLPALAAARSWAAQLRETFAAAGALPRLGVLLVGQGQPYSSREVGRVLGLPVTSALPWAPEAAAVFSIGAWRPRRFEHTSLVRGLRATAAASQAVIAEYRTNLDAGAGAPIVGSR